MSTPGTAVWRDAEFHRLLSFGGARVVHPDGGAAWLGDDGTPQLDRPVHTYVTARMAHVHALAAARGVDAAAPIADALVASLLAAGSAAAGWPTTGGTGPDAAVRSAYDHAFVVLAGATATTTGRAGGPELLTAGLAALERFWEPGPGMHADRLRDGGLDPYRGVNANMHAVEALLAAAAATGEHRWRDRALRIATTAVDVHARAHGWRIPEHFTPGWEPLLQHHRDEPDHPFEPYGATVGHALEWSRLLLELEEALGAAAPAWLRPAAVALHDRAVDDGWAVDGAAGFVYTTDWAGTPVVHDRMHWVVAEAIAATATLHRVTGEDRHLAGHRRYCGYAEDHLLDRHRGSWFHQLDRHNRPTDTVWSGKPDLYHAVQAVLTRTGEPPDA